MLRGARLERPVVFARLLFLVRPAGSRKSPFHLFLWLEVIVSDIFRETEVGERYAKAVFELADAAGQLDAVQADLKTLKALLIESKDLRRLVTSHAFKSEDKLKGLTAVLNTAAPNALTLKALGLMAHNGRLDQVFGLITAFTRLYDAKKGIVSAVVTSATALTDEQVTGLQAALRTALGQDPVLSQTVDPSLLGGLKVRVGSRLFDASLKTKLDSLKFALKRA
ncbi:ATP synthase F1, delta subunit [Asticcacaulis excentricus CB 48]|uniref:ATP synthase subunit delta n=1 Tax=Asticcacaulis excentricus (strain ATCC 15261 / DSM 4724 / KCTC 12464 / NCIMB 9791 / VKM B-1370 / CB 48) TaxID=573065 RepID=E8RPB2_ASTEC|nr:ATP synthase F1, delta subunit [Asticcacaulis excentricus CB 48]